MKTVIATTVFATPEKISNAYFTSLTVQTYEQFDVLVVNDGFDISSAKLEYPELNILEIRPGVSPISNRVILINEIKRLGYDYVIFADFDDYFSEDRVEVTLSYLKHFDLVVNDLNLVTESQINYNYLSERFNNRYQFNIKDIYTKNFVGLSNTGVNTKYLPKMLFTPDVIAFDWYLFSKVLLQSPSAIFTNDTSTYYRQYAENIAGFYASKTDKSEVKLKHYQEMQKLDPHYTGLIIKEQSMLQDSQCIKHPLWWE